MDTFDSPYIARSAIAMLGDIKRVQNSEALATLGCKSKLSEPEPSAKKFRTVPHGAAEPN